MTLLPAGRRVEVVVTSVVHENPPGVMNAGACVTFISLREGDMNEVSALIPDAGNPYHSYGVAEQAAERFANYLRATPAAIATRCFQIVPGES